MKPISNNAHALPARARNTSVAKLKRTHYLPFAKTSKTPSCCTQLHHARCFERCAATTRRLRMTGILIMNTRGTKKVRARAGAAAGGPPAARRVCRKPGDLLYDPQDDPSPARRIHPPDRLTRQPVSQSCLCCSTHTDTHHTHEHTRTHTLESLTIVWLHCLSSMLRERDRKGTNQSACVRACVPVSVH